MLEHIQQVHGSLAGLVASKQLLPFVGLANLQRPILLLPDVSILIFS
jgi:hypothetical protein